MSESLLLRISLSFRISFYRPALSFWNRIVISLISRSTIDLRWLSIMALRSSSSFALLFSVAW